jgi:hypothetical protein
MENIENHGLEHAAEANREREAGQQANQPEGSEGTGNGSVFGNSPRVVSHSSGGEMDLTEDPKTESQQPQATVPQKPEAGQPGKTDEEANTGSEIVNNTGDDLKSAQGDADAASG